jgi:hypothetical protein
MSYIPEKLQQLVIQRAAGRCEYCQLSQVGQEATFHIDHIEPVVVGGKTIAENLALACVLCSLYKAARQTAIDPHSGSEVSLFNPRRDNWHTHFQWDGIYLVGLTPAGRATIETLNMNRVLILAIRYEEALRGRHPPPSQWTTGEDLRS